MRVYELGFILKPDLPEQDAQAMVDMVQQTLTDKGATVDDVDDWGKRKLAYRVRGFWNGHYYFVRYSSDADSSLNRELERRLRVADNVLKYMTVRIDEDLKRQERAKARRAKRVPKQAAKDEAVPAAPQAPGEPVPAQPAETPVPGT